MILALAGGLVVVTVTAWLAGRGSGPHSVTRHALAVPVASPAPVAAAIRADPTASTVSSAPAPTAPPVASLDCSLPYKPSLSELQFGVSPFPTLGHARALNGCHFDSVGIANDTLAAGPQGAWIGASLNAAGCVIVHFDPRTGTPQDHIGLSDLCSTSIVYAQGAVWSLNSGNVALPFHLMRIDPNTSRVLADVALQNFGIPDGGSAHLAVGFGSAWIIPTRGQSGDNELSRIDPATGRIQSRLTLIAQPVSLVVSGSAVWVATSTGLLLRIDPATNRVTASVTTGEGGLNSISVAGSIIWAAGKDLIRVDMATAKIQVAVSGLFASVGSGGNYVWAGGYLGHPPPGQALGPDEQPGLVAQLSSSTGQMIGALSTGTTMGNGVYRIAVGPAGDVWVLNGFTSLITHIVP